MRVHHAPGGKSNFSIGMEETAPAPAPAGGFRKYNNSSSLAFGDENSAPTHGKMPDHRSTNNMGEDNKTSVKVHAAPGGNSSISFGDCSSTTSYSTQKPSAKQTITQVGASPLESNSHTSVRVHAPPGKIINNMR